MSKDYRDTLNLPQTDLSMKAGLAKKEPELLSYWDSIDLYSKILQSYLQSKVTIKCNNKVLKTGKLTLFNIKQYFIRFYIETDKKTNKVLELPYPFLMNVDDGMCTLNYKLTSLCNNHSEMVNALRSVGKSNANKIYDNIVSIIPLN